MPTRSARESRPSISVWPGNSQKQLAAVKDRLAAFVAGGQLGIFTNGYWGHPAMKLSPEVNLLAVSHYLQALAPRVLKLDPAQALPAAGPAYARDLDILPNTLPPQRHLGYAVQWFGLAIAVLVTALVLTFRKRAQRP